MSFSEKIKDYQWDDVRLSIYAKRAVDVQRALGKSKLDLEDFKALLSPAAEPFLEKMAMKSQKITLQRFGKTQQFYIPLYLSNMCSNICTYCGFSMHNALRRKTLDLAEIEEECIAIKKMNFEHILLVAGESERKVGVPYFKQALSVIRKYFSHISLEVQPLDVDEYTELIEHGIDAVLVYQETYNAPTYAEHHLKGKKRDFKYRLDTHDRLGVAGVQKMGLGCLIGLEEWRTDCFYVAAHLQYLEKKYWKSRYTISFPRLRPCAGGAAIKSVMDDKQLLQLICAYRLFNNVVELSLSTRESPSFRDNILALGITSLSAGSSTQPGGYAKTSVKALQQFEISDDRSPQEMAAQVKKLGYEVVWKDWEQCLSGPLRAINDNEARH
ncbi:thiazole biosynthesis protein ThiH [Psychromonas sp. CNPT3]|uniref:2-iminoacetate synthase ThiH n=1 Tax=Psychromonas sp. CNPT3 TaxID=314282 RepID=UPI00006E9E9B|nr:2-iminoacetate synthase ThiH [Psychromonas sp. CNPT3]AGH82190.1 thiazole biosynthesis protein ThiH [Psychromonas sp. CNPT3]